MRLARYHATMAMTNTEKRMAEEEVRDIDGAMMSVMRTIIDVLIAKSVVKPGDLINMFEMQRGEYVKRQMGEAAGVMLQFREFVERRPTVEEREALARTLKGPTKGSA